MRELILRDDDCFELIQGTRRFLELTKMIQVMLAVIPGNIKFNLVSLIKKYPNVTVVQHGWKHINNADKGKPKFEKFDSLDILTGKGMLESLFKNQFYPCFVPPWNKFDGDYKLLYDMGFKKVSDSTNVIDLMKVKDKVMEEIKVPENNTIMTHHTHRNWDDKCWLSLELLIEEENIKWKSIKS